MRHLFRSRESRTVKPPKSGVERQVSECLREIGPREKGPPPESDQFIQTVEQANRWKIRTAQMMNQFQGLQTVEPDMELPPEMSFIPAVLPDDGPVHCKSTAAGDTPRDVT